MLAQPFDLFEEHLGVNDNSVADHRCHIGREDPAWEKVEGERSIADDNGVPCVVPALVPNHEVDTTTEQVGCFSFALVTPLGADEHERRHE